MPWSRVRLCVGLLCWALALGAVLSVARWPGDWGHALCGPWGCAPPLQALVACHGFWCVLLFPPGIVAAARLSAPRRVWAGAVAFAVGLAGLMAIVIVERLTWWPNVPEAFHLYFVQHCLFQLATLIDLPLAQLTVVGMMLLLAGMFRRRKSLGQ